MSVNTDSHTGPSFYFSLCKRLARILWVFAWALFRRCPPPPKFRHRRTLRRWLALSDAEKATMRTNARACFLQTFTVTAAAQRLAGELEAGV